MARAGLIALVFLPVLAFVLPACAGGHEAGARDVLVAGSSAGDTESRPRWLAEIIDPHGDLTIAVRPATLARDPVYGPIVRRASRVAAAHGPPGTRMGATALEALEGCDEVTLAVRSNAPLDAVLVFAGVPASADPAHLVDGDGLPLWQDPHPAPFGVTELTPRDDRVAAALFALPGRTWVVGVGAKGVDRVRAAVTQAPPRAYAPPLGPPVIVHVRGELLDRVRDAAGPALGPLVAGLDQIELALTAGKEGKLEGAFVYDDPRRAREAELRAREILAALARRAKDAGWPADPLADAAVHRTERRVEVNVRVPAMFLRRFAQAEDASL